MALTLDIQIASRSADLPAPEQLSAFVEAALTAGKSADNDPEISLRIVDEDEIQQLNETYRNKAYATNVLSFPADLPADIDVPLLGDIVLCAAVVARESQEQGKSPQAHWAHMVVHGTLHLIGYDHMNSQDADVMERLETEILQTLGYPPPYQIEP